MDAVSAASIQVPSQGSQGVQAAGGHHRHHGEATLDAAAKALGMDPQDVLTSLRSGTSLTDLLDSKGVSRDQLAGVLQDGLLVDAKA